MCVKESMFQRVFRRINQRHQFIFVCAYEWKTVVQTNTKIFFIRRLFITLSAHDYTKILGCKRFTNEFYYKTNVNIGRRRVASRVYY